MPAELMSDTPGPPGVQSGCETGTPAREDRNLRLSGRTVVKGQDYPFIIIIIINGITRVIIRPPVRGESRA
jgi:hypothetical protein